MKFLLECTECKGEARRKYPADPKTLRVYNCTRRACGGSLILVPLEEVFSRNLAAILERERIERGEA